MDRKQGLRKHPRNALQVAGGDWRLQATLAQVAGVPQRAPAVEAGEDYSEQGGGDEEEGEGARATKKSKKGKGERALE